jgi:hypothetical protein
MGRRKKETIVISRTTGTAETYSQAPAASHTTTCEIFRQFFETRFQPLQLNPGTNTAAVQQGATAGEGYNEDGESEWHGITDNEGEPRVEIVEDIDVQNTKGNSLDKKVFIVWLIQSPP